MAEQSFIGMLYTYPWDLVDEGLDVSLGRIAELTGCQEVLLTPCYHRSEYFLPHNPRRPICFGENGAIYFAPQLERYAHTRIQPRVSREVTDAGYFDRMVEEIDKRGMKFSAWMVYTYQNYLTEKYPEFAKHDCFGTPYMGQLSTAPADVEAYFLALTGEVMERYRPEAVWVESLMRRGFPAPGKRRGEIPPRCAFLLALCFNPASVQKANEAGMDGEAFRREVAEWVMSRLAPIPRGEAEPVEAEWIDSAFDGRLAQYLEVSCRTTTALWLAVADVIQQGGAKILTNLADSERARLNDLGPEINGRIDRASQSPADGDLADQVKQWKAQMAEGGQVFVPTSKVGSEAAPLIEEIQTLAAAGVGGATFYNYGLLYEEQLRFIGQALRSLY